jgi:hypothetical protein
MHNKILIADNMLKKRWPCDLYCSFCLYCQETTQHLLADYNYTEVVWDLVAALFDLPSYLHLQS